MTKYTAKCTVYLEINSDYADGVGEAQHEVHSIVRGLKNRIVNVAYATDITILQRNTLRVVPTECDDALWMGNRCIDDGGR